MRKPRLQERVKNKALWQYIGLGILATGTAVAVALAFQPQEPPAAASPNLPLSPQTSAPAAEPWPSMAIIGDSFAVDERSTSWMRRTAWCANYKVQVSGGLGTGFWNDGDNLGTYRDPARMNPVLADKPGLVILESSYNDSFRAERFQDEVRDAIVQTVTDYRKIVPDAKFVIVGPIWAQKPNTVGVENNRVAMREAAQAANVTYIDAIDWLPNVGYTGNDGKHPNEQGHKKLTGELVKALKGLGLIEETGGCESYVDAVPLPGPEPSA